MISTLLDRLFQRSNVPSGAQVKQRLKFILAHDRAAIEPQVFENMRHEIMRVVSKYVELDENSLDIRLESDKRMTALIANLPIRMVREELPDLVMLFDEPSEAEKLTNESSSSQTDSSALEMDLSAEAALDAIAFKETTKSVLENSTSENITEITDRTTEVTSKLRTAANKLQNVENVENIETDKPIKPVEESLQNVGIVISETLPENPNDNDESEKLKEADVDQVDQLELSLDLPESLESQGSVSETSSGNTNPSPE